MYNTRVYRRTEMYETVEVKVNLIQQKPILTDMNIKRRFLLLGNKKIPMSRFGTWVYHLVGEQRNIEHLIHNGCQAAAVVWGIFESYPDVNVSVIDFEKKVYAFDVRTSGAKQIQKEIKNGAMAKSMEKALKNLKKSHGFSNVVVELQLLSNENKQSKDTKLQSKREEVLSETFQELLLQRDFSKAMQLLKNDMAVERDDLAKARHLIRISTCAMAMDNREEMLTHFVTIMSLFSNVQKLPNDEGTNLLIEAMAFSNARFRSGYFIKCMEFCFVLGEMCKKLCNLDQRVNYHWEVIKLMVRSMETLLDLRPGAKLVSECGKYLSKMETKMLRFIQTEESCSNMIRYKGVYYMVILLRNLRAKINRTKITIPLASCVHFATMSNCWVDLPFVHLRLSASRLLLTSDTKMVITYISNYPKLLSKGIMMDPKIAEVHRFLTSEIPVLDKNAQKSCEQPSSSAGSDSKVCGMSLEHEAERQKLKGDSAFANKDFFRALLHYTAANKLDPTRVAYHSARAQVLKEMERHSQFRRACIEGLSVVPMSDKNTPDDIARILALAGIAEAQFDNFPMALHHFERSLAIKMDPEVVYEMKVCQFAQEVSQGLSHQRESAKIEEL